MAVQASTIFSRVKSLLDDDNSARYSESSDLAPALNSAINFVLTVFSKAFEQNKLQPAALSELITAYLYDPTVYGNLAEIQLDNPDTGAIVFNDVVWSIIGVDPNPSAPSNSIEYSSLRFAKRMTMEEWNYALEDPFAPGYDGVPSDFQRVCYTGPLDTVFPVTSSPSLRLLLRPGTLFSDSSSRVGVWVIRKHPAISAGTDELYLPVSIHEFLIQKTVNLIAYQHGNTKYLQVTDKAVNELIQLLN